jgi:hypothetical protein
MRGISSPERTGASSPAKGPTILAVSASIVVLVSCLLLPVGCSSVTGPVDLDEFRWNPMPNPEALVPKAEAMSALSILYMQGLLQTPSPCYGLVGDFKKDGSRLTLSVDANPASGTNCDSGVGGFQYTAVVTGLKRRTYDLRVIHDVQGGARNEYNLSVEVVQ